MARIQARGLKDQSRHCGRGVSLMGKRSSGNAFGKPPSKSLKVVSGTHEGARPWVDRMMKSLETRA